MLKLSRSISRQSQGKFPSVSINNDGTIVEVYQPHIVSNEIYYKVGELNGEEIKMSEDARRLDINYGIYPKVAINNENRVVVVYEGIMQIIRYHVGEVDVRNKMITWHSRVCKLYRGKFPAVAVHGNTVVITCTYDRAPGYFPLYYCVGNFTADGHGIVWEGLHNPENRRLFNSLSSAETSVAINEQNVVIAGQGSTNIMCLVGQFQGNAIEFTKEIPFTSTHLGNRPIVCLDDDGYIIMIWQSTIRELNYVVGNIPNSEQPSITWLQQESVRNDDYGHNRTIAISPIGGHVLEEHEFNDGTRKECSRCSLHYHIGILVKPQRQGEAPVLQSSYFSKAKSQAMVPFLTHKLLECTHDGLEYTFDAHDITFSVPEGAVTAGQNIHFEMAIAMYGPFKFPENTQPISPIVWLCLEEDIELLKPFQISIPHYLTGITEDRYQYHQVCFVKASHSDYVLKGNQINYIFRQCDAKPQFASCGDKTFGVLISKHCCFYCLMANSTKEVINDSEYTLSRVERRVGPQTNEVYFLVTYFLRSCLKVRWIFVVNIIHLMTV